MWHRASPRYVPLALLVGLASLGVWSPAEAAAAPTPTDLAVAALRSLAAGPYQARFSSATTVALTGAGAGSTRSETERGGQFAVETPQRALLTVETGSLAGLRLVGYDGKTYGIGTDGRLKKVSPSLESQLLAVHSFLPPSASGVGRVRDLGVETSPRLARHLQVRMSRASEREVTSGVSLGLAATLGAIANPKHLRVNLTQDLYLDPDTGRALAWAVSLRMSLPGADVAPEAAFAAPRSRLLASQTTSLELEDALPAAVPAPPSNPGTTSRLSDLIVAADTTSSPRAERLRGQAQGRALARRVNAVYTANGGVEIRWRDEDGPNVETFRYVRGRYAGSTLVYGPSGARHRVLYTPAGTFSRGPKAGCWTRTAVDGAIGVRFFDLKGETFEAPYRLGRFLVLKESETSPGATPVHVTYVIDPRSARVVADLQDDGIWDYYRSVPRPAAFPTPSPVCAG